MKKSSAASGKTLALPRHVNHGIDDQVGDMHALRAEVAGEQFREDSLGGLGRREPDEMRLCPRCAEVFPVTMSAPSPASTMAGVVSRARWNRAMVLMSKLC